ncbi:DNA sulfur modification protein DndB [Clostridium perfringens]|uniref:DGQHR domain-containing protein n=1 Tax=Clostridium perfringens TaxID=1502 RepID=A0A127EIP5_CLOPF|nr:MULTISPECIES: DNA sulfur modification protein DndB [Clostridium]AMN35783.1 hypothetical protein JFP838_08490 [Clostridium perfringens]MBO3328057.1 hypothetical protein [Clostridium perfringens]MDK0658054.1 DNA sulfur modification protein DndB [Clostridium perfringens]MDK0682389.1 DNA sulfur modification protein DndB [Clostridium perfringens]MDK7588263.1 DNA sulfur modification protein DndB [Clostridium sp. UMB9555B]
MREFDAIKIDEIKLDNNTENSNIYILKVSYSDLDKLFKIGNISINREVEEERAKKMSEYIKDKNSFYPTIVAATNTKNLINYNENLKTISVKLLGENDKFIVIDGQHRFKSIVGLTEKFDNRYQSVLLIDNINDFQQRKIFIDINDTPKKVTTGTKLRFKKNIENYITLSFLNFDEDILDYIDMDENQAGKNETIPYKYLYRFNEKLLKVLSNNFNKEKILLSEIDNTYMEDLLLINSKIKELIVDELKNESIIKYEVFYIELGLKCSNELNRYFSENKKIDETKIGEIIQKVDNIKISIKDISDRFLQKKCKNQSDRKNAIEEILGEYWG